MANLTLRELLWFLQYETLSYRKPIVFGEVNPKIIETIMSVLSVYQCKIFCTNPYLEDKCSSKSITLQKSLEARDSFPVFSVGIVENSGLDFNEHSPEVGGWPGYSTTQVVIKFAGKLHLLAELQGTTDIYYYCGFAIRWGRESHQVIYIESVTKGRFVVSTESSEDIEELISMQFVPEGQEKTLNQMTIDEKRIFHPRMKALAEVYLVFENNGLIRDTY